MGFPCGPEGKVSDCTVGDPGSIPGSGGSPGEGNGHPLLYACQESSKDGGAWWATVHGVAERLHFHFSFQWVGPKGVCVCLRESVLCSEGPGI